MKQFIAHRITINGQPGICECTENTICWACVQANLIRSNQKASEEDAAMKALCDKIKKIGIRKVGKLADIPHGTMMRWVNTGSINPQYMACITRVVHTLT